MPQELPLYVQINGRFYERIPEDAEPHIFCYVSNLQQRKKKSHYVTACGEQITLLGTAVAIKPNVTCQGCRKALGLPPFIYQKATLDDDQP